MNRAEIAIVILLFLLLIAWGFFQGPRAPGRAQQQQQAVGQPGVTNAVAQPPSGATQETVAAIQPAPPPPTNATQKTDVPAAEPRVADDGHEAEEKVVTLSNDYADVDITSWGGAVKLVRLKKYRATIDVEEEKVELDFTAGPALALRDIPGLSTNNDFEVTLDEAGRSVRIERLTSLGLRFTRLISIGEDYSLRVTDSYANQTNGPVALSGSGLDLGPMSMIRTKAMTRGLSYLDVDTLADYGGARVRRWSKEFRRLFGLKGGLGGCARQDPAALKPAVKAKVGNWTVVPSVTVSALSCRVLPSLVGSTTLVPVLEVVRPLKVKVSTAPILLKNGTNVSRTKRRSGETTACTLNDVPSLSTVMTG